MINRTSHLSQVGNRICLDPFGLYIFTDCFHKDYCLRYVCKPQRVYTNISITILSSNYFSVAVSFCCFRFMLYFFVQSIGLMCYSLT